MRDYLYIWHDSEHQFIVASGLEFKDLQKGLSTTGGVVLIDHQSDTATYDRESGFHFTSSSALSELVAEDIYSWGNFAWADYVGATLPSLTKEEIAELLYFAHKAEPLCGNALPHLRNNFLGYAHDDGWYLKLYYKDWDKAAELLAAAIPMSLGRLSTSELRKGKTAFWLQSGEIHEEEMTHDVDSVLNRRP
jgi:hypothetical protein